MNLEIAKLWIEALRSGEYAQGFGRLRDKDNKFCCLGVLCNLHAQAHPEIASSQLDPLKYLGRERNLPYTVQKWVGFKSLHGGNPKGTSIVELNDKQRKSFRDIADWIEVNVEALR
mgnify:CR=1 FL=1